MPRRKREERPPFEPIRVRGGHPQSIGYARVSTADQNLELQIDSLTRAGCSLIYAEKVSGGSEFRPAFAAMIQALRKGDTVIVHAMDRLGRKMLEVLNAIELFERTGIHLQSLSEHLNTRGPHNKIVMHVLLAVAEMQRNLGRERTNSGLANARKNGRVGGRPVALDETDLETALHMRSKDHTLREIAHKLKVGVATVHRALEGDPRQLKNGL